MVMEWGMGKELGPINYSPDLTQEAYFGGGPDYSQRTAEIIDAEIKRLIDEAYTKVTDLIEGNRDKLEALAQALLKYETLDAEEVKMLLSGEVLDKPTVTDLLKMEQQKKSHNPADKKDKKDDDYDIYAGTEDWDQTEEEQKPRRRDDDPDETFEEDDEKP
jgi:cell division protease FtsH